MPTKVEHLSQVAHNALVLEHLAGIKPACRDWQSTVTFYICVHLVEASWADGGVHCQTHTTRQPEIRRQHKEIWAAYTKLEQISRKARYEVIHPNKSQYAKHVKGPYGEIRAYFAKTGLSTGST